MRVIVNVDDLGLNPAVRRAVADLAVGGPLEHGVVTSSTWMANGPDAEDAAGVDWAALGVGVGVHLNILRGRPLSRMDRVGTLTDQQGRFLGDYGKLFQRYIAGRLDLDQVEREWSLQVERALDMGVRPTHLDSEKHTHAWPTLMRVAGAVARRFDIRWLRRPMECGELMRLDKGGLRTKFLSLCGLLQSTPEGVHLPDAVFGIADQGPDLLPGRFIRYIRNNQGLRVVEICCHPGRSEPGDPPIPEDYGSLRVHKQWRAEYESLSDAAWSQAFISLEAETTHFGNLPADG